MAKFRKKQIVIEAYQTAQPLDISTLEGVMHADAGDWIITGVKGEQYPCKPDIFEMSYEPLDDALFGYQTGYEGGRYSRGRVKT